MIVSLQTPLPAPWPKTPRNRPGSSKLPAEQDSVDSRTDSRGGKTMRTDEVGIFAGSHEMRRCEPPHLIEGQMDTAVSLGLLSPQALRMVWNDRCRSPGTERPSSSTGLEDGRAQRLVCGNHGRHTVHVGQEGAGERRAGKAQGG